MMTAMEVIFGSRRAAMKGWRMAALATIALLTGCDVHEFPTPEEPLPPVAGTAMCVVDLRFETGSMPLYTVVDYEPNSAGGVKGRGVQEPLHDYRYVVNVYAEEEDDSRAPSRAPKETFTFTAPATGEPDYSFRMELPVGYYRVLVWSDYVVSGNVDDLHYASSDFTEITVAGGGVENYPGNLESREAFRGVTTFGISKEDVESGSPEKPFVVRSEVTMKRPLARFRFVTTDVGEFLSRRRAEEAGSRSPQPEGVKPEGVVPDMNDYRVVVRYTGYMPSAYNAHTDKPVDSRLGVWFDGKIKGIDENMAELAFDHLFVNGSETSVQVALDIYARKSGEKIASTNPINVPVVRGKLTEVRGRFLTTFATGGVGINPDFDGEFNIEIK